MTARDPLSPSEMERLKAVKGCDRDVRAMREGGITDYDTHRSAVYWAGCGCPDCALLLVQAIEGPVEEATIQRAKAAIVDVRLQIITLHYGTNG